MKFTFGIITTPNQEQRCYEIIKSIQHEGIPHYQIVVIGNSKISGPRVEAFDFDESIKKAWITKKKNLITEKARFENIVYMHDYLTLVPGWFGGYVKFGDQFEICMNRIVNADGSRYRDWTLWVEDVAKCGIDPSGRRFLLPYDVAHLSKYQYISGAYWVAKTAIMKEFPLDERCGWGQGEDVEWSCRIREKYSFKMNPFSTVRISKERKNPVFEEMNTEEQRHIRQVKTDSNGRVISGN